MRRALEITMIGIVGALIFIAITAAVIVMALGAPALQSPW